MTVIVCNFQLCVILEPMQELMSRHKAYGLNPRDCLKTTLFQKWQRMVAPPGKHHDHIGECVVMFNAQITMLSISYFD